MAFSEQDIRGKAVAFLRHHYRNRPRATTTGTRIETRPHWYQGAKIDARFAFDRPDGTTFTATVEATSIDRAGEIIYQVNYFRIGVYTLAGGLLLLALILWGSTLFHQTVPVDRLSGFVREDFLARTREQSFNWFEAFGRPQVYGYVFSLFVICCALVFSVVQFWPRFRYVYAVEQFKQFHVDDQWIAYDEDVFLGLKDIYHDELRRQCILYGFGMIRVTESGEAVSELNPSHYDQFLGGRSALPAWMAQIKAPPALAELRKRLPAARPVAALPSRSSTGPTPPTAPDVADPLTAGPYLPLPTRDEDVWALPTVARAHPGRPPWYRQPKRQAAHLRYLGRAYLRRFAPAGYEKQPDFFRLETRPLLLGLLGLTGILAALWTQSHYRDTAAENDKQATLNVRDLETAASPEESDADPTLLEGEYDPSGKPITSLIDTDIQTLRLLEDGTRLTDYECLPTFFLDVPVYYIHRGSYPEFSVALAEAERLQRILAAPTAVTLNNCLRLDRAGYTVYLYEPTIDEGRLNYLFRRLSSQTDEEFAVYTIN